jgi:beta-lactamase class A
MTGARLWQRLERDLARRVDGFEGTAGVCVKDLQRGQTIAIGADGIFPTASTIKIHILTQLLRRAERREIDLMRKVRIDPAVCVPGSGVLTYMEGELDLTILDVAILMIIVSDNTATNVCIDLAGMDATNALLRELGITKTTLRRKMQDQAAVARNDENVATPAECVAMLEHLLAGRPSPWVAERALAILKKPKRGWFNIALPPTVIIANKPGGMDRVKCDAGIVFLPRRPYVMSIMTAFGLQEPAEQENWVIDAARAVHDTMALLDRTSDYGQGLVT